jgi:exodeoxyribonuclease VII small subunit
MARKKKEGFDFESNMQALAAIVENIEGGELSLEEAMEQFEKGVKLTKECHVALQTAEQKVKILLEQAGNYTLEEFADEDE